MNSNIVLMDREEVAAMLGVHTETIRRAQHAGKLPAYILGQKLVRYDLADVQVWLKGTRHEGKASAAVQTMDNDTTKGGSHG
jgi:excisionase family DNA binding protein